jgi:hypothetical protein
MKTLPNTEMTYDVFNRWMADLDRHEKRIISLAFSQMAWGRYFGLGSLKPESRAIILDLTSRGIFQTFNRADGRVAYRLTDVGIVLATYMK